MQMQIKRSSLKTNSLSRRDFLRRSSFAAGAAALAFPYVGRVLGANERINIACIGVGGKGESDSSHAFAAGGNVVAICDVDSNTLNARNQSFKEMAKKEGRTYDAKLYSDWRKMLSEMDKSIDAVMEAQKDLVEVVHTLRQVVCVKG